MKNRVFLLASIFLLTMNSLFAQKSNSITEKNGFTVVKIETKEGTVTINLPKNIHAEDIISGTVISEIPKTKKKKKKEKAKQNLNNSKIKICGVVTPLSDKKFQFKVPENTTNIVLQLFDKGMSLISNEKIPFSNTLRTIATPLQIPNYLRSGYPQEIKGAFDGNLTNSIINLNGKHLSILAESPEAIIVEIPENIEGIQELEIIDNDINFTDSIDVINMSLSADKLSLSSGETTNIHMNISGLEYIKIPITVFIDNYTEESVSLQNGNHQELIIKPNMLNENGIYSTNFKITAIHPGGYSLGAEIEQPKLLEYSEPNKKKIGDDRLASEYPNEKKIGDDRLASEYPNEKKIGDDRLASEYPNEKKIGDDRLASEYPNEKKIGDDRLASEYPNEKKIGDDRLASEHPNEKKIGDDRLASEHPNEKKIGDDRLASEYPNEKKIGDDRLASEHPNEKKIGDDRLASEHPNEKKIGNDRLASSEYPNEKKIGDDRLANVNSDILNSDNLLPKKPEEENNNKKCNYIEEGKKKTVNTIKKLDESAKILSNSFRRKCNSCGEYVEWNAYYIPQYKYNCNEQKIFHCTLKKNHKGAHHGNVTIKRDTIATKILRYRYVEISNCKHHKKQKQKWVKSLPKRFK